MASTSKESNEKELVETSVNLFTEPHNRMKELVSWPLTEAAEFSDVHELEPSLQAIYEAMWELKTHEYIENHYIMDTLKQRLHSRRVYNELVCNCHEDSKLLDVIALVESVYQADTQLERVKHGRRLQKAIRSFLEEFLHHMDEEESIFQPLLVENFNSKELKDMKEVVQRQHSFFREKVKSEKSLKALKRKRSDAGDKPSQQEQQLDFSLEDLRFGKSYCQEVSDFLKKNSIPQEGGGASCSSSGIKLDQDQDEDGEIAAKKSKLSSLSQPCYIDQIPEELLVSIFSNLDPRALINCGAVNKRWRQVAYSSVFWKAMYPTQWARGQWSFDFIAPDLKFDDEMMANMSSLSSASSSLSSSVESLPDEEEPEGNNNQIGNVQL